MLFLVENRLDMKSLSLIALTSYKFYLDSWVLQLIIVEAKPTINHAWKNGPHIILYFMIDICLINIKRINDNINWFGIKSGV
jgi:hypothetical protein